MIRRYKTDLRCGACVAAIAPAFDAEPGVERWEADVTSPDKPVAVVGDVSPERVAALLAGKGYRVLGELPAVPPLATLSPPPRPPEPPTSLYPLLLILFYLAVVVGLVEVRAGSFEWMRAMNHFMAGFFLVFSFFKLLDVSAFADAFMMYDVLAKRSRAYALAYPFVELALGVAYLADFRPVPTNAVTLVVMGVGAVGVVRALMAERAIRCACLGSVFNLPMTLVTFVEDGLMAAMAAAMLIAAA